MAVLRAALRPFVSWVTLVSGVATLLLLSLVMPWREAAVIVLLMYVHEAGHVLVALWRRVHVARAPVFIPGFGAYVVVAGGDVWSGIAVRLGGPLIGGGAAAAVYLFGLRSARFNLLTAGATGLFINLISLLPFAPFDGGGVAMAAGRLGFALSLVAGAWVLYRDSSPLYIFFVAYGVWQVHVATKASGGLTRAQVGVGVVHLLVLAVALAVMWWLGPLLWFSWGAPFGSRAGQRLLQFVWWAYTIGLVAEAYAWAPERTPAERYLAGSVPAWSRYLFGRPWMIPLTAALAAQVLGLPGRRLLLGLVRYWSRRKNAVAGEAAAYGYDCLRRRDTSAPDDDPGTHWLREVTPLVVAAGPQAVVAAHWKLRDLGEGSGGWLREACLSAAPADRGLLASAIPAPLANEVAWEFVVRGAPEEGRAFAEAAVERLPADAASLDTLGRIELAAGNAAAAEALFRRALAQAQHPGVALALARSLALQGRYVEAVEEVEPALHLPAEAWPADEPPQDQVDRWVADWRAEADAGQALAGGSDSNSGTSAKKTLP